MNQNLIWRGVLLALVLGAGIVCVLPTFLAAVGLKVPSFLPTGVINLGLDLKGGIYLLMEVDMDVALKNNARRATDDLRRRAADKKIPGLTIENENSQDILV
ncbi:MAG: hypothetical protein LBF41_07395, partial [Deltaproteobacteria bacterium]|nr:hypothetical protein [Deltaproteobacteria bacterium]